MKKREEIKDKKLTVREKLRKNPCAKCGKKMWKFKSISSGGLGCSTRWWECRNCGHKQYFI